MNYNFETKSIILGYDHRAVTKKLKKALHERNRVSCPTDNERKGIRKKNQKRIIKNCPRRSRETPAKQGRTEHMYAREAKLADSYCALLV